MAEGTKISWADDTANFWIGCVEVSPACGDDTGGGCYAKELAERYGWATWGGPRVYCKAGWATARKYQRRAAKNGGVDPVLGRRRRIFVNSLSDFFDNHKTVIWRDDAWQLMRECPDVIFMLLTKRPENIRKMLPPDWGEGWDNVWIGTTVENQKCADHRIPLLLGVPAVLRFLSMEPLLGPVDLTTICTGTYFINALTGLKYHDAPEGVHSATEYGPKIGWVITGGESGDKARMSHPAWFDQIDRACMEAGVPFVFKQWGEWVAVRDLPEEVVESLYYPVPRTRPADSTRRCKVPQAVLQLDGRVEDAFPRGAMTMFRVGRGRDPETLKGQRHLEFPEDRRLAA